MSVIQNQDFKIRRYTQLGYVLLFLTICGVWSLIIGQSPGWDTRNYHLYNVYNLLNDSLFDDYVPAQIQTFINPTFYIHYYLLLHYTPSWIAGFVIGALHGLNLWLIFLIARRVFANLPTAPRAFLEIGSVLLAATAPFFTSYIGTSSSDQISSIFVLAGFFCFLKTVDDRKGKSRGLILISGLFIGIAAGGKFTNMIYALAIVPCFLIVQGSWKEKSRLLIVFGLGGLGGMMISGGYWMWILWDQYESPIFPFYNTIFKSPFIKEVDFKDTRWIPVDKLSALLTYPFLFIYHKGRLTYEQTFSDARWAVLYIEIVVVLIYGMYCIVITKGRNKRYSAWLGNRTLLAVVIFTGVGFIIWLITFGYHRYLLPVELLVGILVIGIIMSAMKRRVISITIIAIVISSIVAITRSPTITRKSWSNDWYNVVVPPMVKIDNTLVLILVGGRPVSYVVRSFGKGFRFIRPFSNIRLKAQYTKLGRELDRIMINHLGKMYALMATSGKLLPTEGQFLAQHKLKVVYGKCKTIDTKGVGRPLKICPVSRKNIVSNDSATSTLANP